MSMQWQCFLVQRQRGHRCSQFGGATRSGHTPRPAGQHCTLREKVRKKECIWLHGCRNKGSWAVRCSWQRLCAAVQSGGVSLCLCAVLSCSMRPTGDHPVRNSMPSAKCLYKRTVYHARLTPPCCTPQTTTAVARRLISNALGNSQVQE
jgi:hypothetical protein